MCGSWWLIFLLRINITGQWACGVDCIIICRRCSCCWRQSSEGTCWSLSLMRFTLYFGGVCVAFALLFVALKLFFWHGLHIRGAIGDACDYYCPSRAEGMVLVLNGSRCPVLTWVNSRPHPVPRLGGPLHFMSTGWQRCFFCCGSKVASPARE